MRRRIENNDRRRYGSSDEVVVGINIDGQESRAVDRFNFRTWKGGER
jgi:hypothetical protein